MSKLSQAILKRHQLEQNIFRLKDFCEIYVKSMRNLTLCHGFAGRDQLDNVILIDGDFTTSVFAKQQFLQFRTNSSIS